MPPLSCASSEDKSFELEVVERLLAQNQDVEAIELTRAAAERQNPNALFTLARWHLIGSPLPRDLGAARKLLRQAVEIGHVDAALIETALMANGSGGTPDWPAAVKLLETAAKSDPLAASQLDQLRAMNIDENGTPRSMPSGAIISETPRVTRFSGLFSLTECAAIAQSVADILQPAVVIDPITGKMRPHPVRTSDGAVVGPTRENLVLRAINQRIATASQTHVQHGEPLSVLRYRVGQEYRPHVDALPSTGNQRIATAIIYLNDEYEGGETLFLTNAVKIRPRAGDMILFSNVTPTGAADPNMRHAGLPILRGTKWIATRWIRERPYNPWAAH